MCFKIQLPKVAFLCKMACVFWGLKLGGLCAKSEVFYHKIQYFEEFEVKNTYATYCCKFYKICIKTQTEIRVDIHGMGVHFLFHTGSGQIYKMQKNTDHFAPKRAEAKGVAKTCILSAKRFPSIDCLQNFCKQLFFPA